MLIFVSYARKDNLAPLNAKTRERFGFVTTLVRRTERTLTDAGVDVVDADVDEPGKDAAGPWVSFFVDTRDISDDAQFDDLIQGKLNRADAFLAVLSNNWIQRPWCQKELQFFAKKFALEADARRRIIVVNKNDVKGVVPSLLQGQNGVRFFDRDRDELGGIFEYFKLNDGPREGFDDAIDRLADIVKRRLIVPPPGPDADESGKPKRRVFIAKPAPDMATRYRNLAEELEQRCGVTIVPDRTLQFSEDMTASAIEDVIDEALHDAELSIHLLGNSHGFTPADSELSIAQLQAARASARRTERPKNKDGVPFQRLFWAPKTLIVVEDDKVYEGRDPQSVCDGVTSRIDDDSVFGENFTKFAQFVEERLAAIAPANSDSRLKEGANVYIQFQAADELYAAKVGKALEAKNLVVDWQRQGGPDAALRHRKFLQQCDAVVVCWSEGFDERALSPFEETMDPRQWGREKDFACRSLVVGPPKTVPGKTIALSLAGKRRDEPDLVLDLTDYPNPPPEAFDPLVEAAEHPKAPATP